MLAENATADTTTHPYPIVTLPWRHPSTFGQSPELLVHGEPFWDKLQPRYRQEDSRSVDLAPGTKPKRQGGAKEARRLTNDGKQ